jgi:hypothetical protein
MDTTTDIKMLATAMPLERLEEEISSFAGRLASSTAMWCFQSEPRANTCGSPEPFPLIRATFLDGEISYSKVRAITRVAIPENEDYLVQLALDGTASQLERVCAGLRRKDRNDRAPRQRGSYSR